MLTQKQKNKHVPENSQRDPIKILDIGGGLVV